jgi:proteasome accessory factor B
MGAEKTSSSSERKPTAGAGKRGSRSDRSKRLLDLVMLLLKARTPVPYRAIRDQFPAYQTRNEEAGLRAFERDKADLLELGVPIRYITPDEDDALEEGGYVVEYKRYRLPEVHLTADEVSALVLAASVARAVPGVSYASIVDLALRKLAFDFPEQPDTPVEFPARASRPARPPVLVHFPTLPAKKDRGLGDRFAQLEEATRHRKRVTLTYQSASTGYVRTRDVFPYGLVYQGGSWLLVGYCHLRQDVRSFRLDRISDLKVAPKPKSPDFDRPEDFELRAYANKSPWTFATEEPEVAVLEFRPAAASAAGGDFGKSAERSEQPDGSIRVRFSCTNPDYAVSRILAAKGDIRVLEGERLAARLAAELAAVEALYREDRT